MDHKNLIGAIASVIAIGSYIPYFWGIYKGTIKPHAFTWFAWGILTGIGFVASLISGGGAGTWIMLINAIHCLSISFIAFYQGRVKYVLFDWLALAGAFLGIVLWWITDNPLIAVTIAASSDVIALLPTVRKAYYFPDEESITPWALGILYYVIAFFALDTINPTTLIYPICIVFFDLVFISEVFIRRRQLQRIMLK